MVKLGEHALSFTLGVDIFTFHLCLCIFVVLFLGFWVFFLSVTLAKTRLGV